MESKTSQIKDLGDVFFAVMKSVFIPDLGDLNTVQMARFQIPGKHGFINYNVSDSGNYFDCNIFTENKEFFKVYIKDRNAELNVGKAITIISTLKPAITP
jgi:hypothetical protein